MFEDWRVVGQVRISDESSKWSSSSKMNRTVKSVIKLKAFSVRISFDRQTQWPLKTLGAMELLKKDGPSVPSDKILAFFGRS